MVKHLIVVTNKALEGDRDRLMGGVKTLEKDMESETSTSLTW